MQGMQSNSTPEEPQEQHLAQHLAQHLSQRPEQRGFASALNGPLEAAKRYIERQKDNESALTAMEDEAGDGRPAWLRRWSGGVPRETESPRQSSVLNSSRGESDPQHPGQHHMGPDTSAPRDHQDQQPGSVTEGSAGYELAPGPSNGYSGHSIEAAFDFETVFQFETELEAESTEDWLDLSDEIDREEVAAQRPSQGSSGGEDFSAVGDSPHGKETVEPSGEDTGLQSSSANVQNPRDAGSDRREDLREMGEKLHPAAQTELRAASLSGSTNRHQHDHETPAGLSGESAFLSDSPVHIPAPDPQAVRAAIFRLAQQSSVGQTSRPQPSAEADNSAFAEVARQVWNKADRTKTSSIGPEESEGMEPGRLRDGVTDQLAMHTEVDGAAQRVESQSIHVPSVQETASGGLREAHAGSPVYDSLATTQESLSDSSQPGTLAKSLEDRVEIRVPRDHTGNQTRDRAVSANPEELSTQQNLGSSGRHGGLEDTQDSRRTEPVDFHGRQAFESLPDLQRGTEGHPQSASRPQGHAWTMTDHTPGDQGAPEGAVWDAAWTGSTSGPRTRQGTASEGPALAHDAGNLLSALKLYSELLALSGVLQARHKHYAEDLKLLAARSEVLIDRLLAACTLAEQQARSLLQTPDEHGLAGPAAAPVDARVSYSGQRAQVQPTARYQVSRPFEAGGRLPVEAGHLGAGPSPSSGMGIETIPASAAQSVAAEARHLPQHRDEILQPDSELRTKSEPNSANGSAAHKSSVAASSPTQSDETSAAPINLVDLLTRWGGLLSMIARGPVQVKFGPQAALPIQVGQEAMERILVNLVHNAMKATKNGGAIRIGVGRAETRRSSHNEGRARPGNRLVLTVDDSGCGMSEEQIAQTLGRSLDQGESGVRHVPERSFPEATTVHNHAQAPGYPRESSGTSESDRNRQGMGLQIVRELIFTSGGEMAIYSRRGIGTRIEIQWPTVDHAAGLERIPPSSVGVTEESWRGYRSERLVPQRAGTSRNSYNETTSSYQQATDSAQQGVEGAIAC